MKLHVKFILVLLPVLGSCTGVQLNYSDNRHHMTDEPAKGRKSPQGVEVGSLSNCPVYVMPPLRAKPPVPLTAFSQIKKEDHRTREALLLDHIEQLHNHIKDLKEDKIAQYKSYRAQCKETSE